MSAPIRGFRTRAAAALLAPALLATAGCSGSGADDRSPEDALAQAKQELDDTPGVEIALTTEELPEGVDGVLEATGTGTHAPAFEGSLKVRLNSITVDVPVVAVGGEVYAELPFTSKFTEVDPADYSAPDPALLMDPSSGLSSWLTAADDLEKGEQVRDGDTVLTGYDGVLPGETVAQVIPSADDAAEFPVVFLVDDDGLLRSIEVSGPFYGDAVVDYTVSLDEYGTEKDITRP